MTTHLIPIGFDAGHSHRVRNFGEDLWRALSEDKWASTSLDEADLATTRLCVSVFSRRQVRRVHKYVLKLLERDFPDKAFRISMVQEMPETLNSKAKHG